jgi:thiol-disulfide isomerase/thioredoxin
MKKNTVVITWLFLSCSWNSNAQIVEKIVKNFTGYGNVTYTSTLREKDFFSDNISNDTIRALISTEPGKLKPFKIKGTSQEEIYDGNKLFRLDFGNSTYRVSKKTENSFYFYRSLSYLISGIEENVKKNNLIIQLPDSIIKGVSYYYLHIINLDTIKNNKRIFNLVSLLVDKKTYLPYYYKNDIQGFIDGTNTFVTSFFEYYFFDYKINNKSFPDLTLTQVPSNFTLKKPTKPLLLLENGTKAPEVELSYAGGNVFNLEKGKGKVILLNFTMNGCPHCVESIETLNRLFAKYKSDDFIIVSINPFDTQESVLNFNSRFNVKYPAFISSEKSNKNIENYHVGGYPTFYLINKQGNIAKGFSGYYSTLEEELVDSIDMLKGL